MYDSPSGSIISSQESTVPLRECIEILSSEYARNDDTKITAEILGDVVYKLYDTSSADKSQVKTIEKELE